MRRNEESNRGRKETGRSRPQRFEACCIHHSSCLPLNPPQQCHRSGILLEQLLLLFAQTKIEPEVEETRRGM